MSRTFPLRALAIVGLALLVPQAAAANGFYTNTISGGDNDPTPPDNGYNSSAVLNGPWTLSHPDPAGGFATAQGSTSGDGAGLAVHARAVGSGDLNRNSESILLADFQIFHPLGALVDVTITGTYLLEVFGRGSARVESWICQGFTNQCVVNQTFLAFLANDVILANLTPTNEVRRETYIWSGTLPSNVPLTIKLRAQANAFPPGSQARAFVDPLFTFETEFASLTLDASARLDNENFIPLPEPTLGLWLLPLVFAAGRRPARPGAR
jgi:hypothetical protein